jgi:hypothetical protein
VPACLPPPPILPQCADLNLSASFSVFQLEGMSAELKASVAGLDCAQKVLLENDAAARASGERLEVAAGKAAARLAAIETALADIKQPRAGEDPEAAEARIAKLEQRISARFDDMVAGIKDVGLIGSAVNHIDDEVAQVHALAKKVYDSIEAIGPAMNHMDDELGAVRKAVGELLRRAEVADKVAPEFKVGPALEALQVRVLLAFGSAATMGADPRVKPLLESLGIANAWLKSHADQDVAVDGSVVRRIAELDADLSARCAAMGVDADLAVFRLEGASAKLQAEMKAAIAGLGDAQKALLVDLRESDKEARAQQKKLLDALAACDEQARARGERANASAEEAAERLAAIEASLALAAANDVANRGEAAARLVAIEAALADASAKGPAEAKALVAQIEARLAALREHADADNAALGTQLAGLLNSVDDEFSRAAVRFDLLDRNFDNLSSDMRKIAASVAQLLRRSEAQALPAPSRAPSSGAAAALAYPRSIILATEASKLRARAHTIEEGLATVKVVLAIAHVHIKGVEAAAARHNTEAQRLCREAEAEEKSADDAYNAGAGGNKAARVAHLNERTQAAAAMRERAKDEEAKAVKVLEGAVGDREAAAQAQAQIEHAEAMARNFMDEAKIKSAEVAEAAAAEAAASREKDAAKLDSTAQAKEAEAKKKRSDALLSLGFVSGGSEDGDIEAALAALARAKKAGKAAADAREDAEAKDAAGAALVAAAHTKSAAALAALKACEAKADAFRDAGDITSYDAEKAKAPALDKIWHDKIADEKRLAAEEAAAAKVRAATISALAKTASEAAAEAGNNGSEASIKAAEDRLAVARAAAAILVEEAKHKHAEAALLRGAFTPPEPPKLKPAVPPQPPQAPPQPSQPLPQPTQPPLLPQSPLPPLPPQPLQPPPPKRGQVKIAVVGAPRAGKTSLIEHFSGERLDAATGSLVRDTLVGNLHVKVQLCELKPPFTPAPGAPADACVLVYDVADAQSFAALERYRADFVKAAGIKDPKRFPFVVIGNKTDLPKRGTTDAAVTAWCAHEPRTAHFLVSAYTISSLETISDAFVCAVRAVLERA